MSAHPPEQVKENPWRVPLRVEDVPEGGRHVVLEADAAVRAAVREFAGVLDVSELRAAFEVTRKGREGLRVVGEVRGRVGQTCIVSLEPMESEIVEPVDVVYAPPDEAAAAAAATPEGDEDIHLVDSEDPPEPLIDGAADLGALATEFLILGIDPYPRKPGASFAAPAAEPGSSGPFAALAKLKRGDDGGK
jgi:hypothetical protein